MGKVGSSTIKNSLECISISALHIHRYFFNSYETKGGTLTFLRKIKSRLLYNYYIKQKDVKVITLFRDPLLRNISSFFQNLERYFSKKQLHSLNFNLLREKFNTLERIHKTPNDWFFSEFLKKTGINILNFPFDKEAGYVIIKHKNVEYFICTLEMLNSLDTKIANFINNEDFRLLNENQGHVKWYSGLYNEFKTKYSPTKDMLKMLYDSRITKYFYDSDTINKFKKNWMRSSSLRRKNQKV